MVDSKASGLCRLLAVITCLPAAILLPFDTGPNVKQATAETGDNVTIFCPHTTPITEADWIRFPPGSTTEVEICLSTGCLNGFAKRFSFDKRDNFRLTILNVTTYDNGDYTCIVYDDFQIRYTTTLTVNDPPVDILTDTTMTSLGQTSTTATHREPDSLLIVALAIGVTAAVVVTATTLAIVLHCYTRRRKGTKDKPTINQHENGSGNIKSTRGGVKSAYIGTQQLQQARLEETTIANNVDELHTKVIEEDEDHEDRDSLCKILSDNDDDDDDKRQKEISTPEKEKTITSIVSTKDSRLLFVSFLTLFRQFRNAAEAFKVLAGVSQQWWNCFSEIDVKKDTQRLIYYERSGYVRRATRLAPLTATSCNRPVMGVALLDGNFYSVHKGSDSVDMIRDQTQIHVPGMKFPVDIVACKLTKLLYIADKHRRCIWRVSINGNSVKWKDFDRLTPKALSMRASSLLVTTESKFIVKYKQNGKWLAKIALTMEPEHAVETIKNTFLVSCKTGRGYVIVEVRFDGYELRRFVCSSQLLRFPSYLVLDGNERLLVADFYNSRILLPDAKLKHAVCLLNHRNDGIAAPQRLCLDQDTGNLLVVRWQSSSVSVYGVKNS